jgi:hypothetical protein
MEPEYAADACAAIEGFMAEVRKHVRVAKLDDPNAISDGMNDGIPRRYISNEQHELLVALVRQGVGITEICARTRVSNTLVYKYRRRILGHTRMGKRAKRVPQTT